MVQLANTAVVSAGPIYPAGRSITGAKGLVNGIVATFTDQSPHVIAAYYGAIINWGDGSVSEINLSGTSAPEGSIRGANGSFQVYGKHQYTGGTTYPIDVTVKSLINSNTGYAWSTATLSGVPTHQPPFAQSHITGQIGNPGYGSGYLNEEVTLVNSGNIASGPLSLVFYLSDTSNTQPISSNAVALRVGGNSSYKTDSIPAGHAIEGSVSKIILPPGGIDPGEVYHHAGGHSGSNCGSYVLPARIC